jgi:hypothetical protein
MQLKHTALFCVLSSFAADFYKTAVGRRDPLSKLTAGETAKIGCDHEEK